MKTGEKNAPLFATRDLIFGGFLHYPDLRVEAEAVTFVSGASGCGKSTLLKLFNGTASPSAGSVTYRGEDVSLCEPIALRRRALLVKQAVYLFGGSVAENFKAFHGYHESACPADAEIASYLRLCALPVSPDALTDTMSGGERQRVFLSIALSLASETLLLDEPTAALNRELSVQVLKNIVDYTKEKHMSLLVISHDGALQKAFAEQVITLGGTA